MDLKKITIMKINSAKDLLVYKKAYDLAMKIFSITKKFPAEERYALTSQIRRSSRSVCMNLNEAWAKRRYEAHFISKLTDCDGEINETSTSFDFARDCGYIKVDEYEQCIFECREIGKMMGSMIQNSAKFIIH